MAQPTSPAFSFPPIYDFPPFYTRQPTEATWHDQLKLWESVILAYCQHHRLFRLTLANALYDGLFHNRTLGRKLSYDMARDIINYMVKQGTAEWVTKASESECIIYWRKPDAWASLIHAWVSENGMNNTVFTVYELAHDDNMTGTEMYDMDAMVLRRALDVLAAQGKAQLFQSDNSPSNIG
ncbi:hypothetical protein H4R35_002984, partial [Dimargaris xerosporica]